MQSVGCETDYFIAASTVSFEPVSEARIKDYIAGQGFNREVLVRVHSQTLWVSRRRVA